MSSAIEQTTETYGIDNWGAGYFGVNRKGHLVVRAPENDNLTADVKEVIDDLGKRGVNTPVLLRFPQLLAGQIRKLQTAFKKSIKEFEYQGGHLCVYPMKVNQNRAVLEEYLRSFTLQFWLGGRFKGRTIWSTRPGAIQRKSART